LKEEETLVWQKLFGPLNVGTKVSFRDRRCKMGFMTGTIWYVVPDEYGPHNNPRTYAYVVKTKVGTYRVRRARKVVAVLDQT